MSVTVCGALGVAFRSRSQEEEKGWAYDKLEA